MIFTITELEHHPILYDVVYHPGEIDLPDELRQVGGLHVKGSTELLKNTLGEIRLRGHVTVEIEAACDRCLEPAKVPVDSDFDLFYRPVEKVETHGEIHLEEGEIDLSFYEGDSVALRDVLREFVLLSLPMRTVCSEECQGLCPVCGENRNEKSCGCNVAHHDERWAGLKGLEL
jgi:uncharacterized protein